MKNQVSLRDRALRLLARREHSRAELAGKLARHATPEDLDALLEELVSRKLVSDERYAEARARTLAQKYGAARIVHELRSKGLSKELAVQTGRAAEESEAARAREVWRRKFGSPPQSREERARQIRFLQSRGFSFEAIRAVITFGLDES